MLIEDENDINTSIDLDLQEIEGAVEPEWQTRVPTSMKIIHEPAKQSVTQGTLTRVSPANAPIVQAINDQYDVIDHSTSIKVHGDEDRE